MALTPQRRRVLVLIAQEYENSEIAAMMKLSVTTVKGHAKALVRHYGSRGRLGVVTRAILCGDLSKDILPKKRFQKPLSDREYEVLDLMSLGLDRHGVAKRMRISTHAVWCHLEAALAKLDCKKAEEALHKLGLEK